MSLKKILLKFISIVFIAFFGHAQQDSSFIHNRELLNAIFNEKNLEKKTDLLINFSEIMAEKGFFSISLNFSNQAKELASKLDYNYKAKILLSNGKINFFKGNMSSSLSSFLKAKEIYEAHKDQKGLARCYNSLANIYYGIGKDDIAAKYLKKAIKINFANKDYKSLQANYCNLGSIYESIDIKEGIKYFEMARKISDKNKETPLILSYLSEYYLLINDTLTSKELDREAFDKAKNDPKILTALYLSKSSFYLEINDHVEAVKLINKGLEIAKSTDDKVASIGFYMLLGQNYLKNNVEEAIRNFKKALKIASEIEYPKKIQECALALNNAYLKLNDYKSAYQYYHTFVTQDSIMDNQKIQEIELLSELTQKNQQIDLVKLDKDLEISEGKKEKNAILFFSTILILLIIYVGFRLHTKQLKETQNQLSNEVKKQTENLERANQIQSMLTSTLIHDLKSPLLFLSRVAKRIHLNTDALSKKELQEMSKELESYSQHLIMFIDKFVTWAQTKKNNFQPNIAKINSTEIIKEIEYLYLDICKKNGNDLVLNLNDVYLNTDKELFVIILRNIVDNANKNTFKGQISINSYSNENESTIEIKDTGKGMSPELVRELLTSSEQNYEFSREKLGYKIILEFVKLINGSIHIESEGQQAGTKVSLIFKT